MGTLFWSHLRHGHGSLAHPAGRRGPPLVHRDARGSLRAAEEITGHKDETIRRWLRPAAQQADVITEALVHDLHLTEVEVEAFWSFVQKST